MSQQQHHSDEDVIDEEHDQHTSMPQGTIQTSNKQLILVAIVGVIVLIAAAVYFSRSFSSFLLFNR